MTTGTISETEIRMALASVSGSDLLAQQERLKDFLAYVTEEEITGRGDCIRGKTIAQDVYGRDPLEGGDSDNVVRVDARRLRQILDHYYQTTGSSDPVRIHVDTGGYRPRFERIETLKSPPFRNRWRSAGLPLATFAGGSLIGVTVSLMLFAQPENSGSLQVRNDPLTNLKRQAIFDKSPASLQAVNLAAQARSMIYPIFDRPRQQLVTEVFRRVIELDPDYFGGYAGAAQTIAILAIISPPGPNRDNLVAVADQMSGEAIRLAPAEPWAQSARSWTKLAERNYDEAMRFAQRAAEIAPQDGFILDSLGTVALFSGNFSEAVAATEMAREFGADSHRSSNRNIFAASSFHLKNYQASLDAFQSAAEYGDPVSAPSLVFQIADLHALGRTNEAMAKLDHLNVAWPGVDPGVMLRGIYQHPEHANEVLSHLAELGWTPGNQDD